jgi:hypothetical protein
MLEVEGRSASVSVVSAALVDVRPQVSVVGRADSNRVVHVLFWYAGNRRVINVRGCTPCFYQRTSWVVRNSLIVY